MASLDDAVAAAVDRAAAVDNDTEDGLMAALMLSGFDLDYQDVGALAVHAANVTVRDIAGGSDPVGAISGTWASAFLVGLLYQDLRHAEGES